MPLSLRFTIVRDLFEPFDCRSFPMMLPLIANIVYHPLQILRAKADHTITALPIQQLPIHQFVIDVVGTGTL
jgi:hypothetical protein